MINRIQNPSIYIPSFKHINDFEQKKEVVSKLLKKGYSKEKIAKKINKTPEWVEKYFIYTKEMCFNHLSKTTVNQINKMKQLGFTLIETAKIVNKPISNIEKIYECFDAVSDKNLRYLEERVINLFDSGSKIDEISSRCYITEKDVIRILKKAQRNTESWLQYTTLIEDKILGRIINKLKISKDEISKSINL